MKRNPLTKIFALFLSCLAGILLTNCALLPQITTVEGEEHDQIITLGEPLADNIFSAINNGNYSQFSRDFDEVMKKALDEKAFNEMIQVFIPKIGLYQSRTIEKVELVDTIYVITYRAKFEKEDPVYVRLSLRQGAKLQVAGLYFDSPRLREE